MIKLNNWSVTSRPDTNPYAAPETMQPSLQGDCYHPVLGLGPVITSRILKVKGRVVSTRSGSTYLLGTIAKSYRAWLKKHRPDWDWRNPIKVIGDVG